jgi:tRNA splicing endonuclease
MSCSTADISWYIVVYRVVKLVSRGISRKIKEMCHVIRMETEKEIEHQSAIMEMRNVTKNQERVIEELMLKMRNIIKIKERDEEMMLEELYSKEECI